MAKKTTAVASLSMLLAAMSLVACAQSGSTGSSVNSKQLDSGIIGGTVATASDPFAGSVVMVANIHPDPSQPAGKEMALCTGSILSDDIVVTAAHCVSDTTGAPAQPSDLRVAFGLSLDDKSVVPAAVTAFKINPLWKTHQNDDLNTGDIALVKFAGGLPAGYQAAQILQDTSVLTNGATVLLAGYGIDDGVKQTGSGILRSVNVTIQQSDYSQSEVLMDQSSGKGACHGDSGGPAYIQVNGQLMLFGVTSRGVNDPKNICDVSAAYTSIPYYAKFITSGMKSLEKKKTGDDPDDSGAAVVAQAQ